MKSWSESSFVLKVYDAEWWVGIRSSQERLAPFSLGSAVSQYEEEVMAVVVALRLGILMSRHLVLARSSITSS